MLKQYSTDLRMKWNLNILMLVVVEKVIYQAQSLKQSYFQTKTKTSESEKRSMCDNFKCYSLNVGHACSIVVHKWVWMLDMTL